MKLEQTELQQSELQQSVSEDIQSVNNIETLGQAISVLIQGVTLGQTKGIYSFSDASLINQALLLIQKLSEEGDKS